jgi:AmiR/NasT family two-component response regulator
MSGDSPEALVVGHNLRVLIANELPERLAVVTEILTSLGHVVVAAGVEADHIGEATRRERPDVALVALGESSEHALEMISNIVHEAACPVIALLHASDPSFVNPQQTGRKLIDLADAVAESHRLLAPPPDRAGEKP